MGRSRVYPLLHAMSQGELHVQARAEAVDARSPAAAGIGPTAAGGMLSLRGFHPLTNVVRMAARPAFDEPDQIGVGWIGQDDL